ncbi:MAG: hypothetical protein WCO86_15045 [Planctomycetota bacterium]
MRFSFYPQHEHNCPNVSHCPHLGGAALGTLVLLANEQELSRRAMHASLDAARARGDRLFEENQRLQKELDQVKLELKLERRHQLSQNPAGDRRTLRHHVHPGGDDRRARSRNARLIWLEPRATGRS